MRIRTLAVAAGALVLAACSGNTTNGTSGSNGSSGGSCTMANAATCPCTADTDCAGIGSEWTCDPEKKLCTFQCRQASDCTGPQAPDDVKTACSGSSLGCTCDYDQSTQLSSCNTKVCGTDADCPGGNVCESGQCVSSEVSSVDSCTIAPEFVTMNAGSSQTFSVQAYKGGTPVRVADSDVTWSVGASAPLTNSNGKFTVNSSITQTQATTYNGAIVASLRSGQVTCKANVQVYQANTAGIRVTVIDALAGVPLQGATVMVDTNPAQTTDANGMASFASITDGNPHTISVFDQGFDYVTLYMTKATDILIPVTRNADANIGGVTGTVNNLFQANGDIHAGFVGMSIPGSITDVSLTLLEGPDEPLCDLADKSQCSISSFSFGDVNAPSGVLIGLNTNDYKQHYLALGAAGWCANADGSENTQAVQAGTCGTRGIWGLAGDIDISTLGPIIDQVGSGGGLSNLNLGGILGQLLPTLRNFNSLVQRDQSITLGPPDTSTGTPPNTPTSSNLKQVDLDNAPGGANAVKLSLALKVKLGELPHYPTPTSSTWADGAIVLAGSDVPGRGLFPLGLTAGLDNDGTSTAPAGVDGHVSYDTTAGDQSTEVKDIVNLNMAPAHHGTESGTYRMAVLAASFSDLSGGLVGSGIVTNPGPCTAGSAPTGICYGSTIDLSNQTFMAFPTGSSFDYAGRSFTVGTLDSATKLARLDFHDSADHRWFIYFDPSAVTTVNVPAAPASFGDRTRSDDTPTGPRSTLLALNLDLGGATADNAYTFGNGQASLVKLDKYISRFVLKDYAPPSIKITAPAANASISAASGSVTVSISGDDANGNKARLCVTADNNPVTDISNCSAASAGDGTTTQTFPLPGNAAQGAQFLHAVLVTSDGTGLLNPSVEASEQVTITP